MPFDPPITGHHPDSLHPPTRDGVDWMGQGYWTHTPQGPVLVGLAFHHILRGRAPTDEDGERVAQDSVLHTLMAATIPPRPEAPWCPSCQRAPSTLLFTRSLSGNTQRIKSHKNNTPWICLRCCGQHTAPRWKPISAHHQLGTISSLYAFANKHTLHLYTPAHKDMG